MGLQELTAELLEACEQAIERFYDMRERNAEPDFFNEVKPYADNMHTKLQIWRELAYEWIIVNRPKYMHKQQINHAFEAMEQFFVQSFYKATSKKRFIQSVQSTKYTLTTLMRYVEEGQSHAK